jgi:hypothetical protein
MAVQIAVSAVLGDPTVLIAGIMGSLMSRTWSCGIIIFQTTNDTLLDLSVVTY